MLFQAFRVTFYFFFFLYGEYWLLRSIRRRREVTKFVRSNRIISRKRKLAYFIYLDSTLLPISRTTRNITRIIWNLISAYLPRYGGCYCILIEMHSLKDNIVSIQPCVRMYTEKKISGKKMQISINCSRSIRSRVSFFYPCIPFSVSHPCVCKSFRYQIISALNFYSSYSSSKRTWRYAKRYFIPLPLPPFIQKIQSKFSLKLCQILYLLLYLLRT